MRHFASRPSCFKLRSITQLTPKPIVYTLYYSFFFGKNSLMQIALGKSEEDEPKPNLHLVGDVRVLHPQ